MKVQKYLSQLAYLSHSIQNKLLQIEELASLAERVTVALDGMPRQKGRRYDGRSNTLDILMDQRISLEISLGKLSQLKADILSVINGVKTGECKSLLEKRYIDLKFWKEIAGEMHYSIQHIYRLRAKAHKEAEEIIEKLGINLSDES